MTLKKLYLNYLIHDIIKNTPSLYMLDKYSKNKVLTSTILDIIDLDDIFRLTHPINVVFLILNIKLTNLAVFLSN